MYNWGRKETLQENKQKFKFFASAVIGGAKEGLHLFIKASEAVLVEPKQTAASYQSKTVFSKSSEELKLR